MQRVVRQGIFLTGVEAARVMRGGIQARNQLVRKWKDDEPNRQPVKKPALRDMRRRKERFDHIEIGVPVALRLPRLQRADFRSLVLRQADASAGERNVPVPDQAPGCPPWYPFADFII